MQTKTIISTVIVLAALAGIGYLALVGKHPSVLQQSENPPSTSNGTEQSYANSDFSFSYPNALTVNAEGNAVTLTHAIVYAHPDPCNFKGDKPVLQNLTDFNVSLALDNEGLKDAITRNEKSDYIATNFMSNGQLVLSPGFIDEFKAGSLNGFQITNSAEGCGRLTYYFPISQTKTLVVNRALITEFNPIIANYQTYLRLPGIIPPDEEQKLFVNLLSSVQMK